MADGLADTAADLSKVLLPDVQRVQAAERHATLVRAQLLRATLDTIKVDSSSLYHHEPKEPRHRHTKIELAMSTSEHSIVDPGASQLVCKVCRQSALRSLAAEWLATPCRAPHNVASYSLASLGSISIQCSKAYDFVGSLGSTDISCSRI